MKNFVIIKNVFNKNIYDDDKIFHQYGTLFVSNKSFYLKCKLFLISRICDFCSKFQFLFKTSQYPGFSRIPGFLAILFYTIFWLKIQIKKLWFKN